MHLGLSSGEYGLSSGLAGDWLGLLVMNRLRTIWVYCGLTAWLDEQATGLVYQTQEGGLVYDVTGQTNTRRRRGRRMRALAGEAAAAATTCCRSSAARRWGASGGRKAAARKYWAKMEGANPAGSVKDRIAKAMIDAAERGRES